MIILDIIERKSIRAFQSGYIISKEEIEDILKAGMSAPSARNSRPWEFVVLQEREVLDKMADFHPYGKSLFTASMAIVVCGNPTKDGVQDEYWVEGCSAATENMLLAIHAQKSGGVWLGIHPKEERCGFLRDLLEIPPEVIPFAIIAVGKPAVDDAESKKNCWDEQIVHWGKWSKDTCLS